MNEQQQKMLEDRISDALLEPLTDEQLQQMDQLLDNPATTEDGVEQFLRQIGVDVEGISQRVTQDFIKEQGIQVAASAQPQPAQPVQPQAQPVAQPQPIVSQQSAARPQPAIQPQPVAQPAQPVQPIQQPIQSAPAQGAIS